ncbi:hypothetical protein [Erythrobacter alti]
MALFGAIGTALAMFGLAGLLCGGGLLGGNWCWRYWRGKRASRKPPKR